MLYPRPRNRNRLLYGGRNPRKAAHVPHHFDKINLLLGRRVTPELRLDRCEHGHGLAHHIRGNLDLRETDEVTRADDQAELDASRVRDDHAHAGLAVVFVSGAPDPRLPDFVAENTRVGRAAEGELYGAVQVGAGGDFRGHKINDDTA